jgi:hypothetical protein
MIAEKLLAKELELTAFEAEFETLTQEEKVSNIITLLDSDDFETNTQLISFLKTQKDILLSIKSN